MAALREEDIGLADKNQRVYVAYGHINAPIFYCFARKYHGGKSLAYQ